MIEYFSCYVLENTCTLFLSVAVFKRSNLSSPDAAGCVQPTMSQSVVATTKLIPILVSWKWKSVEGDPSDSVVRSLGNILENVELSFRKEQEIIFTDNQKSFNVSLE